MAEVVDSAKTYPCQMVLLAMGFLGAETKVRELHLATWPPGHLAT